MRQTSQSENQANGGVLNADYNQTQVYSKPAPVPNSSTSDAQFSDMVNFQSSEHVNRASKKFNFDFTKCSPALAHGTQGQNQYTWHRSANFIEYQREDMLAKTETKPRLSLGDLKLKRWSDVQPQSSDKEKAQQIAPLGVGCGRSSLFSKHTMDTTFSKSQYMQEMGKLSFSFDTTMNQGPAVQRLSEFNSDLNDRDKCLFGITEEEDELALSLRTSNAEGGRMSAALAVRS